MAVLTKITTRSLADNAVTAAKIQADTIVAGDLAPNSVGVSELADDAVDVAAIADDAVTNAAIADGAIDTTAKIADDVISGGKLTNDIAISTTGNIATTGSGSITAGGTLTATGATNLNDGLKQQASKAVTGTLTAKQVLMGDAYSLTGDLTVNNEVKLGTIAPKEDVVLMSDSTSANRTITGTGTLELGSISASQQPQESAIIAGGLTADADISDALDASLATKKIKRNVIVGHARQTFAYRTSVPAHSNYSLWERACVLRKKYSDTMIHATGHLPGYQKHSYPGFFCWVEAVTSSGVIIRKYEGAWYYHHGYHTNNAVSGAFDAIFYPSELQGEIGNVHINWGWRTKDGTAGRPFVIWNPNHSDDGRGTYQHSICNMWELYGGEDGAWDNKRNDQ